VAEKAYNSLMLRARKHWFWVRRLPACQHAGGVRTRMGTLFPGLT